ncbi:MAG: DNA-binding transcriptional regulator [Verrucomicrobia bacterium]|jgi:LacI family transcriptional regulator|nr:DNA-binding transcriptional regulator [Verrucomicrobiota bacterium]
MAPQRASGTRRRFQVALLIETSNAFAREVLLGVRDWMEAHDTWAVHLSEQGRGNEPPGWLRHWQGHGIIARVETREIAAAVRRRNVPVVNVSAAGVTEEFPTVISDSAGIARAAAEHLRERGLRQFGYCGDARFAWSESHGRHFAALVSRWGCTCQTYPAAVDDAADWDREQEKLRAWLRVLPRPCGVMVCYDIRGQQVLDVCRALGLRVPDDLAVIGQHNDALLCELCNPPLSSVIPNARQVGWEAAAMLDRWMHGRAPRVKRLEIPPLGVATRQSTDLVAVGDERLARAARYIREHYRQPFMVDELARAAGLSRSLLERNYRAAFGLAPWEHVLKLRLRDAEALLVQTRWSVAEIAERTGFGAAAYFSAAFRRLTGRPPSALRG